GPRPGPRPGRWCPSTGTGRATRSSPAQCSWRASGTTLMARLRHDRDRFLGVHEDLVAHARGDQRDADIFLALAGVDDREVVIEQPHDPDRDGRVRAGDTHVVVALPAFCGHATTPGSSRPGCSKNTCTSSQSTWYVVTCTSLTIRGSADLARSR